jgi:hypothetical protein
MKIFDSAFKILTQYANGETLKECSLFKIKPELNPF